MAEHDVFKDASSYESYVGRWSRQLAPAFVDWLGVPGASRWLDVGCGTGALTQSILQRAQPEAVVGIDPSRPFIKHLAATVLDPRASFYVGNAMALEFSGDSFDAAASALVLNFVPDPLRAACEMRRVTKPGGMVGAYVWAYADGMRMMRIFWDAALALDPAAGDLDEGARFPICRPTALRACFEAAGFADVEVSALDCEMAFADFDDYWTPFLGAQGPAPAYAMSLTDSNRQRLRDLIRARLPIDNDGTIHLTSTAWAVRGVAAGAPPSRD